MAEIVPLPKQRRLKSLDEFEPPARAAQRPRRPVAFGLLLTLATAAGAVGGLLLSWAVLS